jgi:RsiW-degrading membrane proteinase PrsW (M82 family)
MIKYLLDIIGFILIVKWFRVQRNDFKNLKNKSEYFKFNRFKSIFIASLLLLSPILIINFTSIETSFHITDKSLRKNNVLYAYLISFLISTVWFLYIYKLDIFNKEKKRHLIAIFLLSCAFTLLTNYPYEFIHSLGFVNRQEFWPSLAYSIFGIGFIEETIKFISFLIILKFTKAIDEPYDYILYASIAALGFSFIENAMYLNNYGLHIISARALYATVAHMTFSSIIVYGLFLIKYKKTKIPAPIIFVLFYFLAIFAHGFYDFWLINKSLTKFQGLTTLFFLATVHIWFVMKNNTINTSNYFNTSKSINNDRLKIYLIISLISVFMLSYIYVAFKFNSKQANKFLIKSAITYGYIIFYLIATLSKFDVIKGLVKPFRLNISFFIPKSRK